jgi:hypothetical protein
VALHRAPDRLIAVRPRFGGTLRHPPEKAGPVINSVVVSYTIKPECLEEHVQLIEGVFDQLRTEAPATVEYKVMRLDDGVSFVHVSTADTPDGANPLPELAAFKAFQQDLGARLATPPNASGASAVGNYRPA